MEGGALGGTALGGAAEVPTTRAGTVTLVFMVKFLRLLETVYCKRSETTEDSSSKLE